MTISKKDFTQLVKQFKFKELLLDLGWDNDNTTVNVEIDEYSYILTSVAQKRSFRVLTCSPDSRGLIPSYSERLKISNKVKTSFHDHLIVFCDSAKTEQLWQLIYNQNGQTKKSEIRYNTSQAPEKLYQRTSGLFFNLDDEDKITIIDVEDLVKSNFGSNAEKVTKKFYDNFKKQHKALLEFIKGIDEQLDKEWYASLMLNRLMFCYFIQKQGFLDDNKNYLREKLIECKEKHGNDKFYSFYRQFLLVLFHKGLGSHERDKALISEIGNVPYLNGGLFDEHEIEKKYPEIAINDDAFESIFDFFDEYDWHLDNRVTSSGKEINPDVLGYIFEKYINDRAQMGAYYTQEDITDYISRNCIIPYLFSETKRHYQAPFKSDGFIWQMLKGSGDQYIYDAVKKGVELPLPANIEAGVDTSKPGLLERRKDWNQPAGEEYALPTEIWRETIERRQRYAEVLSKIQNGEITDINDFITYNLNICQFAQDIIDNIDDPDFIRHFYKVLLSMTILDPTCGSGAFLFATMNILEPLYEKCINRMDNYCHDDKGKRYKFFEDELYKVESEHHPNRQYFIYKSIILNNLYGVDIMNEAVETAKLRLFLKLVSTVDPNPAKENMGLEPLPDIDFNIKCGNTLVGYANEDEMKDALVGSFDAMAMSTEVLEKCLYVAKATQRYKEIQLNFDENFKEFKAAKKELLTRQNQLNDILNKRLFEQYKAIDYQHWKKIYQPFHWVAEFYDIIANHNGFDVIIGNPPYVVYNDKFSYKISNYKTRDCKNLYAFVIERAETLCDKRNIGFIIPSAAFGTISTNSLRNILTCRPSTTYIAYLSGDAHPAVLFEGVKLRLSILISNCISANMATIFTSNYLKWYSIEREFLFKNKVYYFDATSNISNTYPKINKAIELSIIEKMSNKHVKLISMISKRPTKFKVFYHNAPVFFIRAMNFIPTFESSTSNEPSSNHFKVIYLYSKDVENFTLSLLNSSTFFFWFTNYSANRDLTTYDIVNFPIVNSSYEVTKLSSSLNIMNNDLMQDLECNSKMRKYNYKTGKVIYQEFYMRKSKIFIDKIDKVLAQHYNFTDEELDYIINYDIKYRMGSDTEDNE